MSELRPALLAEFRSLVGPAGYVEPGPALAPHLVEWRGLFQGTAPLMVMPASVEEAAAVIRLCATHRIGVVPQGGNTGLVGGGIPRSTSTHPEIILSSRRLTKIRALDRDNFTITAEAGCVLAVLQQAASAAGRLFPLSLAAEGSCQLGGNISTNAGGTAVLRYGNTRDLILGLEVVLPDGRVYEGLRTVRKDNTGYDIKQFFIGAEGTLGFITAATCKLFAEPASTGTAIVACPDPAAAVRLFAEARSRLGEEIVGFELMDRTSVEMVLKNIAGTRDPLSQATPWLVLIELSAARAGARLDGDLESFLANMLEKGLVSDGVVAASGREREQFWRLRHSISEAQKHEGDSIKHDISVPISQVPEFLLRAGDWVRRHVPGGRIVAFGHLGDGNLHYNVSQPPGRPAGELRRRWTEVTAQIHQIAVELGGSFSAEHGIGSLKVDDLEQLRSDVDLDLMRRLKRALDPTGIMNPGKLLRQADRAG